MKSITHREMRNNSADVLRRAESGESLQVTNNGRVAAVIMPVSCDALEAAITIGAARPARTSIEALRSIRRATTSRTTAAIIEDARGRW